ncbi:MAG TPA: GNAT family N-acetyltransferase [Anaerolineae bacterium]|nr:GNAT family N-acetyltransferase [Anaerolineae bacterium]
MATLRLLTGDDHAAILELWQRAGLHSIRPEGRDSRGEFEKQLAGGQIVIGLEEDDQLIGVVLATHDTRKGWINRLAIDPDHRRQGYGEQLVQAAEEALREAGMKLIAAFIEEGNDASLTLFKKLGYAVHQNIYYVSKRDSAEA